MEDVGPGQGVNYMPSHGGNRERVKPGPLASFYHLSTIVKAGPLLGTEARKLESLLGFLRASNNCHCLQTGQFQRNNGRSK
jgi:hypothetical protein